MSIIRSVKLHLILHAFHYTICRNAIQERQTEERTSVHRRITNKFMVKSTSGQPSMEVCYFVPFITFSGRSRFSQMGARNLGLGRVIGNNIFLGQILNKKFINMKNNRAGWSGAHTICPLNPPMISIRNT